MYYINKLVFFFLNPLMMGILILIAGSVLYRLHHRKASWIVTFCGWTWLWFWASNLPSFMIGAPLERSFPAEPMSHLPCADAIVELGGGMGYNKVSSTAEMFPAADRAWMAARLWKFGKAPFVIPSGRGTDASDAAFILDYGVSEGALECETESRNTEENVRFVSHVIRRKIKKAEPTILLVTSAWHMRRALLMFEKYAPAFEVHPVAVDYEFSMATAEGLSAADFVPSAEGLYRGTYLFKELLGYWGYRLLR